MDIVLKAAEVELLPDLGMSLAAQLEQGSGSVRQLQARVPGVASEPVTTAILVAIAGQASAVLAQRLFSAIADWVKRHHTSVTLEVPLDSAKTSGEGTILITPENLTHSDVRARLLALLALTED